MEELSTRQFFDLSNFPFKDLFENVKYPWEVLPNLESLINARKNQFLSLGFTQKSENVWIGKNVTIDDSLKIDGTVIIGNNSTIGDNVFLRKGVIIGNNTHIGHAVEIKNSVIMDDTAIAHLNYVGDSVIGSNVNFSGGAITANWRFDKMEVGIRLGDKRISTNSAKMGSIIGDNSFIGVNAVLNPGTVLGKGVLVYPLVSVKGTHPEGAVIH